MSNLGNLAWVTGAIHDALESAPSSLRLYFQLHVTRDPASDSERGTNPNYGPICTNDHFLAIIDILDDKMLKHDCIRIASGRPNVRARLEEELADAQGLVSVNGLSQVSRLGDQLITLFIYSGWTYGIGFRCERGVTIRSRGSSSHLKRRPQRYFACGDLLHCG